MQNPAMYQNFGRQQNYMYSRGMPSYNTNMGQPFMCHPLGAQSNLIQTQRSKLSTEWAPNKTCPNPPQMIQPSEIHLKDIGHIPNYAGHIPGAKFRVGKTFGNDSKDAKRWIRGDRSL